MKKILVINLGSTSTKIAYYEETVCKYKATLEHDAGALNMFSEILDQKEYRKEQILNELMKIGVSPKELDAIVTRGGHTHPISGGIYRINNRMTEEVRSGDYGRHATDIGVILASELAEEYKILPLTVDPPVTDEFEVLARYTGHPLFSRRSSFHALNHRAAARQYAADHNLSYTDLNLIVCHMGGGTTISAHKKGQMIDANNGIDGDGPFSSNRTGTLPVGALVKMCFSGDYTYAEVRKMINGQGGLAAYLGITDLRLIEKEIENGNAEYKECLDAMLYQTCKDIGGLATVLQGNVDAIVLTGGMIHSEYVRKYIRKSCGFIAQIAEYPGEFEMQSLADGAIRALNDPAVIKEI